MIVVDTSAVVGLLDADSASHAALRELYDDNPALWTLPWAILPELDYLIGKHLGEQVRKAFLSDLAEGTFAVEWGSDGDLAAAPN